MITRINNKKSGKTRTPYSFDFLKDPRTRVVVGLIFMLFSIYLLVSLVGFFFTGGMDQSLIDKETRELMTNPDIVVGNPGRMKGIPCTFILDGENRIVAKNLRGKDLEKKIDEMLKKKK